MTMEAWLANLGTYEIQDYEAVGLLAKAREQDAKIAALENTIAELRAQIAALTPDVVK